MLSRARRLSSDFATYHGAKPVSVAWNMSAVGSLGQQGQNASQLLQQVVSQLQTITPPAQIASDWHTALGDLQQLASALGSTNLADPSAAAQLEQKVAPLEQSLTTVGKRITDLERVASRVSFYREQGRRIVFTNGCFDILHRGHVTYLAEARALGACLVVGLNSDASARSLGKGPDRPLNGEADRACVLAALESVAPVTLFDESTPLALLELVRPDVYVKGGDYDIEQLAETALVRRWGGQARALPFVEGYSTSALVRRIRGVR